MAVDSIDLYLSTVRLAWVNLNLKNGSPYKWERVNYNQFVKETENLQAKMKKEVNSRQNYLNEIWLRHQVAGVLP